MDYQRIVKELREKLILSQQEFADLLGVSFASINRWETGRYEPTIKTKRKIVELCKENNISVVNSENSK
ncbi:MAG: helix-turn-helix domain-containing protein [Bacilli bacterium]|jgi:putative transcriptional regulator